MTLACLVPTMGDGRRQQARHRKIYQLLDDQPLLAHTLARLEQHPGIDAIFPIALPEEVGFVRALVAQHLGRSKVVDVLEGRLLRQDFMQQALLRIGPAYDLVMIHDGCRPLVSVELISRVIAAAEVHGAAVSTVPTYDTLKAVSRESFITQGIERRRLRILQTPQVFRYDMLARAYAHAARENFYGSDEVQLVERLGERIKGVPGSHLNLYVATREDVALARALLKLEPESLDPEPGDVTESDGGQRQQREKE